MNSAFPRARHLELSFAPDDSADSAPESDALAKAEGAQGLLVEANRLAQLPGAQLAAKGEPIPMYLARAASIELWRARGGDDNDACLDENGNRAGGNVPVLCPSSLPGRIQLQRAAADAASRSDAVVLEGIDRWYALGDAEVGYCANCERALDEMIRQSYGEQVQPFAALQGLKASALAFAERPFAGMRLHTRLTEPVSLVRMAALAARDAARKARGAEISVLARASKLSALSMLSARHLDGLILALPSADPHDALLPLLCARAAMGERAAIAELPASATTDQVRQLAALATACDADVMLAAGSSPEAQAALLEHRRFAGMLRERFRPAASLSDVDVLIAPLAEHLSRGAHLRASSFAVAALGRAQLQLAIRLDEPAATREGAKLLVLAGAEALPDFLAPALRHHVQSGSDLLLLGRCDRVDEEGRLLGALFPEAKPGIERLGEGRIFWLPATDSALPYDWSQLESPLQKALRELLARTPKTLSISGRGQLWARAYLDPERKLDVHLVNLDLRDSGFAPAQGVLLQIAGAAAGGGRTGYWFAHDRGGKEGERIALNPSGFSVSTVLPAVGASALLSVPR